jgi:hypothetical protein
VVKKKIWFLVSFLKKQESRSLNERASKKSWVYHRDNFLTNLASPHDSHNCIIKDYSRYGSGVKKNYGGQVCVVRVGNSEDCLSCMEYSLFVCIVIFPGLFFVCVSLFVRSQWNRKHPGKIATYFNRLFCSKWLMTTQVRASSSRASNGCRHLNVIKAQREAINGSFV